MDFSNRKYVLFDLDGTLTDSQEGIFNSVRYAAERLGLERPSVKILQKFIGPSLLSSFMEYLKLPEKKAQEAVGYYRELYGTVGVLQCITYPGMEALLEQLTAQGKRCGVATIKPQVFAERMLIHLGIDQYFTAILGTSLQAHSNDKSALLETALDQMGVMDKNQAIMVGDTSLDCLGAAKTGIDCIGILHGAGDEEALRQSGAIAIAANTSELSELLLPGKKAYK